MTWDEYRDFTGTVCVYPGAGTQHPVAILYTVMGLGDESGEVLGKAKKIIRGDGEVNQGLLFRSPWDILMARLGALHRSEGLKAEVGDALFYLTRILVENGWSLEEIMEANTKKLSKRKDDGTIKGSGDNR